MLAICVKGLRGAAFKETKCVHIDKDAAVVRRKRARVMAKETGSFDRIDDARGACDIVNLMGTVDVCWGGCVVLKHCVGIE